MQYMHVYMLKYVYIHMHIYARIVSINYIYILSKLKKYLCECNCSDT